MPVLAMSAGRVTAIWGSASVRLPDGTLKPLQVGDVVAGGERIVTDENGMVQISPMSSASSPAVVTKTAEPITAIEKVIAGVDAHDPDQAPAAGLTGGADGGLQPGLRVERVTELESGRQQSFEFESSTRTDAPLNGPSASHLGGFSQTVGVLPEPPHVLPIDNASVTEGGALDFVIKLSSGSTTVTQLKLLLSMTGDQHGAPPGIDVDHMQVTLSDGTMLDIKTDALGQHYDLPASSSAESVTVHIPTLVVPNGDSIETVKLSASTPFDAEPQTAIGAVDHRPYMLVLDGEPATEGDPLVFNVVLTHAIDHDVIVKLDLQPGVDDPFTPQNESASLDTDVDSRLEYLDASGQWHDVVDSAVTIGAGQTLVQVRVATVDDGAAEDTEYVKLHAVVVDEGWTVNTEHANQTPIIDNDLPYLLVQYGEPAVEGQAIVFDVVLTHGLEQAVTIKLDLQSGVDDPDTPENESATAGADADTQLEYQDASGKWHDVVDGAVTMDAWQTLLHVRAATIDDHIAEDTEYIKLHASIVETGLTANLEHANQTAIIDNDLPYMLVRSGESAVEGEPIVFDVTLTHAASLDVAVTLALGAGIDDDRTPEHEAAIPGFDTGSQLEYLDGAGQWLALPDDGRVTFAPGETLIQVRVATNLDNLAEDTEYIKLNATVVEDGLTANKSQFNQTAIVDKNSISGVLEPIHLHVSENGQVSGQVFDGLLSASGGVGQPDGLFEHVASITVDGVVHGYDANASTLDLTTSHGGHLNVDMQSGHYSYVAPAIAPTGAESDVIDFSLLNQQHQVLSSTMDIRLDQASNTPGFVSGDVLDLRDVLQGENTVGGTGNLDHYLAFDTSGSDTVMKVSLYGELVNGQAPPGVGATDVVLPGINLRSELGLDANAANVQVIARLLDQGKLLVDHG